MKFPTLTIQQKITTLLLIYFVIAFVAITSTLFVSGRLEGGAAAINDAGSERMRSYQIAFLLGQYIDTSSEKLITEIDQAIAKFEQTLITLEKGDPDRPLLLPKKKGIRLSLQNIQQTWLQQNKPYVNAILTEADKEKAALLLKEYNEDLKIFVADIDVLVVMVEKSQAQATRLLRTFQNGLVALAFVGTLLLLSLFARMVITPVQRLKKGLDKMGQGDFSIRLPVTSNDEFGDLAGGFNHMVKQLQEIYATLEQRIRTKTNTLEMKSQELSALYNTASFLNTSTSTEILCDGVLGKMVTLFGAEAGVIRLVDHKGKGVPIIACHGVSEDFLAEENQLQCGECLCGDTANGEAAVSYNVSDQLVSEKTCKREGFEGVVSVPVKARERVIGVFNLFFHQPRILPPSEVRLLETVCQHLGAAIENQHFVDREKEMAVSEERNLLAQELHDSIAQSLAFLNIQTQLLQDGLRKGQAEQVDKTLIQIKEGIQESYDDVRELLVHFRTRIEHDDIDVAIRDALEKFEGQTGIETHYEFEGNVLTLQPEIILQFLHILHECLSNIRKHSQATQVDVQLSHGRECQLIIHDNGIGFDNTKDAGETHVGLRIMKERTHRIDGALTIDSSPEEGTTICLTLPLATNVIAKELAYR
ncbi:MAG: histidine kinase [Gammaproteobacteria bacterium]|nr:MAG: histidine kinase [Gammaproteobacteria bacterium]